MQQLPPEDISKMEETQNYQCEKVHPGSPTLNLQGFRKGLKHRETAALQISN